MLSIIFWALALETNTKTNRHAAIDRVYFIFELLFISMGLYAAMRNPLSVSELMIITGAVDNTIVTKYSQA
jgi:hypothetical protein